MAVDILWRALSGWPANYPKTSYWERPRCPFRTAWSSTLSDLDLELRNLGASDVVIEVDMDESQIAKTTGRPRADALTRTPGVVLQFERDGEHLIFPCDRFGDWQDNIRAIALTLNALRMMERYGTTSGRQYQGFKALPSQGTTTTTTEEAERTVRRYAPSTNGVITDQAIRVAKAAAHPDRGGSHEAFVAVVDAEKALRAAGRVR